MWAHGRRARDTNSIAGRGSMPSIKAAQWFSGLKLYLSENAHQFIRALRIRLEKDLKQLQTRLVRA